MHVEWEGGSAELKDSPSVGARQDLRTRAAVVWHEIFAQGVTADDMSEWDSIPPSVYNEGVADAFNAFSNLAIISLLKSWTLPSPVPRTVEELRALESEEEVDAADALATAVAPRLFALAQGLRTTAASAVDPATGRPDPESPTLPSSGSGTGGEEAAIPATSPIRRLSPALSPTPTESFSPELLTSSS